MRTNLRICTQLIFLLVLVLAIATMKTATATSTAHTQESKTGEKAAAVIGVEGNNHSNNNNNILMTPSFAVGLTTIPPRFGSVYVTVQSWLEQQYPPKYICIFVPSKYKRFQQRQKKKDKDKDKEKDMEDENKNSGTFFK